MTTPERNIYWKDVMLGNDEVEERKNLFIVHRYGSPFAVVFWHGNEANKAQMFLRGISFALCSHKECNIRVSKLGEMCPTHKS
jgi:hypothetical protein